MPGRKRKNRKVRDRERDHRPPRKESTKGKEIVDEELVKSRAIKHAEVDDFSDGGFGCPECAWTTPRKGNSGIQALRAHSKVHVRDRRAVVNTLFVQVAVLVVAVAIALTPMLLQNGLSDVVSNFRLNVPVGTEPIIVTTSIVSISFTVSILLTGRQYGMKGKRQWWFNYTWSVRLLVAFMLLLASLKWLEHEQDIWLPWLAPVLVPWVVWVLIGGEVALTHLSVKRGTFKPRNQRKLLKSKNELTDQRIGIFRRGVVVNIRNGLIVLGKLSKTRRDSYDRLGVGKTQLSKRSQRWRLQKEVESRREIKRRDLKNKQRQDRRNTGDDESFNERY